MTRARGFTLIEMVIATAIATMLVAAVWSTTQSMSAVARRQAEAGRHGAELERAIALIRRDLYGALAQQTGRQREARQQPGSGVLLELTTLADSPLVLAMLNAKFPGGRRTAAVRYAVQPSAGGFELERTEMFDGQPGSRLVLLKTERAPEVLWLEKDRWVPKPSGKEAPKTLLLVLDDARVAIRRP